MLLNYAIAGQAEQGYSDELRRRFIGLMNKAKAYKGANATEGDSSNKPVPKKLFQRMFGG